LDDKGVAHAQIIYYIPFTNPMLNPTLGSVTALLHVLIGRRHSTEKQAVPVNVNQMHLNLYLALMMDSDMENIHVILLRSELQHWNNSGNSAPRRYIALHHYHSSGHSVVSGSHVG
jgi:hypothetical protein